MKRLVLLALLLCAESAGATTRLREVEWPAGMTRTDRKPRRRHAADAWAA